MLSVPPKSVSLGRRERVSPCHQADTRLLQLNQTLSEDARNLTATLRGSAKAQGNWGELIRERVLEASDDLAMVPKLARVPAACATAKPIASTMPAVSRPSVSVWNFVFEAFETFPRRMSAFTTNRASRWESRKAYYSTVFVKRSA